MNWRFFLFIVVTAVVVVVVVVDVCFVVDHDVGAAARAQLAGAVGPAGAGVALVLHGLDDQTFSGFGKKIEEEESSKDQ